MISMYEHLFNRSLVWWRLSPGYAAEVANGYAEDPAPALPLKPASRRPRAIRAAEASVPLVLQWPCRRRRQWLCRRPRAGHAAETGCCPGVGPSAVSHQLKTLKAHDLVRTRRKGKFVYYRISDLHVELIMKMGTDHLAEQIGSFEEEKDPMKGNKSSEGEENGKMEG